MPNSNFNFEDNTVNTNNSYSRPEGCKILSEYKNVADLNANHRVYVVQHEKTNKVFVKKVLDIYNLNVYRILLDEQIQGTPKIEALFYATDNTELVVIEEYISGNTLEEMLNDSRHFTVDEIVKIGKNLCETLGRLHENMIIHRDIKPSNVIITPEGEAILIDMNAAKILSSGKNRDTMLIGTEGYAAPEQYGFRASDSRTDIYSLGVLLKELTDTCIESDPKITELKNIIDKCREMNPDDRYKNISELYEKLKGLADTKAGSASGKNMDPGKRKYLPPGFRTGQPCNILAAIAMYTFVIYLSASTPYQGVTGPVLIVLKILTFIMCLMLIFFTGNYLDIHSRIVICRSDNLLVRIIGILLFDVIIFAIMFVIMTVLTVLG